MLKLFNTAVRKKKVFKPLRKNEARIYSCGPTVYDFAHIGNLRTYIFADILRRSLEFLGYRVKQVVNITDVGHLTQDSDLGEDKIEKSAKEKKKSAWEVARFYEEQFLKDIAQLNILSPHIMPRATQHIKEQINIIKTLEKKGFTYVIKGDGVYFDTSKFKKYGEFAGKNRLNKRVSRVGEKELKKNPWDFALWKFSPSPESGQRRQMEWSSPWGIGFPGWHIECSAMSKKYLSQPFDIHTGGVDHVSVHHQNEIAQSESAFGVPLANFWLHSEFLNLGNKRMGKSEGNLIILDSLIKSGFDPLAFRLLCLNTHYRKKMFFDFKALGVAQKSLNNIAALYQKLLNIVFDSNKTNNNSRIKKIGERAIKNIKNAIEDDLNTPRALGSLFNYISQINQELKRGISKEDAINVIKTLKKADKIFALLPNEKDLKIQKKIIKMLKQRERYRMTKNFKKSDGIRSKIQKMGFTIEDYTNFTTIYKLWPK